MTRPRAVAEVPRRIAVIGGGFSGAAFAIHVARSALARVDLTVVEPRASVGGGLAHGRAEPVWRLNGPDTIHSPYPQAPSHFADWLRSRGELAADPQAVAASGLVFARRAAFGRYMAAEFERCGDRDRVRVEHRRARVTQLAIDGDTLAFELDDGGTLRVDQAVIATGWDAVGVPAPLAGLAGNRRWLPDPWSLGPLDDLPADAPVLLVGSGLTASDVFASLHARGHRGPVVALSRHGRRPASQNPHRSSRPLWERIVDPAPAILRGADPPRDPRAALRLLRAALAEVDTATSSWHVPFDELRDASALFWPLWSERERRRWVRHLKSRYDAFRYRNPPQVERVIDDALRDGRLRFDTGRLVAARAHGDRIEVEYDAPQGATRRRLQAALVVNCTGPQPRPGASGNPLWRSLIAQGLARDDACGLGVDVDAVGRLIDARGRAHARLYALGPPTAGRFGEAYAVPWVVRRIGPILDAMGIERDPDA